MHSKSCLRALSGAALAALLAAISTPAWTADHDAHGDRAFHDHDGDRDRDDDRDHDRQGRRSPRVVLISLDGAKPDFIEKFIA
ncbi:MAG: phosphodiesterase, partial [Bradyrhizobium sp.]|nr:phosphodiesterase [Bradyrhizobium sp.]